MDQKKFDDIWNSLEPKPHQRTYDFKWVIDEVEKIKPKVIIEIGLANGGSLRYWEQILLDSNKDNEKDCLLISLENNPSCVPTWDWKNSKIDIHAVYGNSSDINIVKDVGNILAERKIDFVDFLFIDGEHRHSIPEKDFNNYGNFVRNGGIICIADLGEPCPAHTLLQLPEPREVDPTIGMSIWRKSADIKVKECNNQGESTGETYIQILDIFRSRVPNPP